MIKLYGLDHAPIRGLKNYKDYHIESTLSSGDKVLYVSVPINEGKDIRTEMYLHTPDQEYVIKEIIDATHDGYRDIVAKLNLEDLAGKSFDRFDSTEQTLPACIALALVGTGWTVGECEIKKKRTIRMTNSSAKEVIEQACKTYSAEVLYDTKHRKVSFYEEVGEDRGVYFSDQLNMKRLSRQINSHEFYTMIIPVGKDGLTIESINNGVVYLENHQYSSKKLVYRWKDERYTNPESLMEDAARKLNDLSRPKTSFLADIVDLSEVKGGKYGVLDYHLGDTVTILSKELGTREKQRIVGLDAYPDEPYRNTAEISNTVLSFEEYAKRAQDAANAVGNITNDNGQIDGDTVDKIYSRQVVDLENSVVEMAVIKDLQTDVIQVTDTLTAVKADIGTLKVNIAEIEDITAGMVTTEYLEANYAQIDLANIKEGCITTAMIGTGVIGTTQIADGSITDAKIVGLTANKITAGTLDAAEIDVVNLNCANLTVGTINGQQIAPGAVDMDKLGQDAAGAITGAASDAAQALEDAAAAFQAAQNATAAAGAAQASADGKNTVYYQEGLPPPYGHKINDVCFDTSEDNCIFSWTGESWTQVQFGTNAIANASITNALIADATIQSAKIAFLDAAKITTGTLSAGRIAANSITADKIAVGDFTNYATISEAIPESEIVNNHPFGSRGSIIKAGYVIKQMPGYTYLPLTQYRTNAFDDGDELYFSLSIKGDTSGSFRFCVRFYGDGSADDKTYKTYFAVSGLSYTGTEQTCTGSIKLGTCRSYSYYVIVLEDANSALGQIYVRNIQVRKKSQGALIVDGAITAVKIAANAITADKISSNAITAVKIAANTITGDKIAASTITAKNLAADCITSDKIVADAITTGKIAARAVTANEIAANAISAEKIAAGAISTDKLAAGAVTAGKINVTSLQAISANIGGFSIGGSYIAKGTTSLAGAANSVYLGTNGISCGTDFKVTSTGKLNCTDGSFSGTITSNNATITGGTINIITSSEKSSVIKLRSTNDRFNFSTTITPSQIVIDDTKQLIQRLVLLNIGTYLQHSNGNIIASMLSAEGFGIISVNDSNDNNEVRLSGEDGSVNANIIKAETWKGKVWQGKSNDPSGAAQVNTNYALYVKNYAGTDPQEIIAGKYTTASSEKFKSNISPYLENALDLIRRSPVYSYNRKIDLEKGISKKEIGFVIERGAPDCIVNETRDAVNMYSISGILWKGMQEIDSRMAVSESREKQLEQRVEYLQQQLTRAYTLMAAHGIKEDVQ